jgi:hypothetical protein
VGQHEDVNSAVPWRETLVEGDEQAARIRPTIDEETPAAAALDEDPVALPDVEDHDPDGPIGPMSERHGKRHRGGREAE